MAKTRWTTWGFVILLSALVSWLYFPGLSGGFFFDDQPNLITSTNIQLDSLSFESLLSALSGNRPGISGRPVAQASFALNYLANGLDPFDYKATNLAIHLLCSCLVFLLSCRLLKSCSGTQTWQELLPAVLLTSAWALHPIQLLPVLHVVQRMTSLSALFLFAALILHIDGRTKKSVLRLALSWMLFWPLSFCAKETGLLFPLFAFAWESILRTQPPRSADRFARILGATLVVLTISTIIYLTLPPGDWIWAGYEFRSFSPGERLLTEARVVWNYLALIGLPQLKTLALYHDDIPLSTTWFSPWTTLPALIGLTGLASGAILVRKKYPEISFGIIWFLIGHLLESTILPLEIAHEHRNYVPLFGVLLIPAWLFSKIPPSKRITATVFSSSFLVYLALVTHLRADQFGEEIRRTQLESQFHRSSARAQYDAGRALANLPAATSASTPTFSFAKGHFERALDIDPAAKMPWLALVLLHCNAEQPPSASWVDTFRELLANTSFTPGDQTVIYVLKETAISGALCLSPGEIRAVFDSTLSNPRLSNQMRAFAYSWQADYFWLGEHNLSAAKESLANALKLRPRDPSDSLKWAQLLMIEGRTQEARALLHNLEKKKLSPNDKKTLRELLDSKSIAGFK